MSGCVNTTITGSRSDLTKIRKFCKDEGRKISPFLISCALETINHHEKHYVPLKRGFWR